VVEKDEFYGWLESFCCLSSAIAAVAAAVAALLMSKCV
jgi:hypothetical protein